MPLVSRRPTDRSVRPARARATGILIGVVLLLAAVPAPRAGAAPAPGTDGAGDLAAALRPSIQYEQAVAHSRDAATFRVGDRVKVAFTPRTTDRWAVDGRNPISLPAGRLTGKAIRDTQPRLDAPRDHDALSPSTHPTGPIDTPLVDPAAATSTHLAAVVDPGGLRREVFGFLPYWEIADPSTRLDWEKLSTIAYFGVGAAANGDLQRTNADGSTTVGWSGWTSSNLTGVIDAAHANGARVVLTVQSFGWTSSELGRQKALLGNAAARDNLAQQIAAAVRDRGADGVNLDFEPIAATYADEFTSLIRSIRTQLDTIAPGYQLTFDTMGWVGNYPIEDATAAGAADAVVVMGYDYKTGTSGNAGSVSPIGGPTYDLNDTLATYVSRIPAAKVILGVPYYGRAWSTSSSALNATTVSAAKYGASVAVLYGTALDFSGQYGRLFDPVEGTAWTTYQKENCTTAYGCVTATRELYYDDAQTLAAKYDLVNSYGIRGVGIWALGYDGSRPELYQALKDKFITDTIPPAITGSTVSQSVFSPNGDGSQDSTTVSVSVTGLIRYGWVVEPFVDGTAGPPVVSGSADGETVAYTWDGRGQDGSPAPDGTYRITVWTADASDNRSSVEQLVTVDTTAPVLTATAAPASISPNGDHRADSATLGMLSNEPVSGVTRILDRARVVVRAWKFEATTTGTWTWDARDLAGKTLRDGVYTLKVDGLDPAGNRTVLETPVLVDRTIGSLAWDSSSFRPGAGRTDRITFSLTRPATVTVSIYQGTTFIRRIWTNRAAAAGSFAWKWDGRTGHHELVDPGTYRAVITATSWVGTSSLTRTVRVKAR